MRYGLPHVDVMKDDLLRTCIQTTRHDETYDV